MAFYAVPEPEIDKSRSSFYAHRVWKLSGEKWITSAPIVRSHCSHVVFIHIEWIKLQIFLSLARLAFALVSTVKMAEVTDFQVFAQKYKPIFTTGLALSAATDILIASILCYFLRVQRDGLRSTKQMIDTIIVITINNGALTCAAAVAALVCWVSMSNSLVYMGLHFCIGKLYANSLLATLNMRNWLRYRKTPATSGSHPHSDQVIAFSDDPRNKIHTDAAVRRYISDPQMSPTPAAIAAARVSI
ncbi:hypothetical protein EWM64_g6881 [Hericium alpestre]|uniref:DUF6534 domain-containing protein n=1 Tax=Hericium alpestre TaxID=135208 RepID=A0A4Y9ZTI0_9AGAM|nr:hypothetical protein EWM64_g6881 [Hericium alpestre]